MAQIKFTINSSLFLLVLMFFNANEKPLFAEVINAGIPGNTSTDMLKRLKPDVLEQHPSVVVLMVGTNDRLNSRKFVSAEKYRQNVQAMILQIRASGADVLLVTPPPCLDDYLFLRHDAEKFKDQSPAERLEEIQKILIDLAAVEQVGILDFHNDLKDHKLVNHGEMSLIRNVKNSNTKDGVHLTFAGDQRLARMIADKLQMAKLETTRVICFGDSLTHGRTKEGAKTVSGENYPAELKRLLVQQNADVKAVPEQ